MSIFPSLVASVKLHSNARRINARVEHTPAEASASDGAGMFFAIYGSDYHAPSLTQE